MTLVLTDLFTRAQTVPSQASRWCWCRCAVAEFRLFSLSAVEVCVFVAAVQSAERGRVAGPDQCRSDVACLSRPLCCRLSSEIGFLPPARTSSFSGSFSAGADWFACCRDSYSEMMPLMKPEHINISEPSIIADAPPRGPGDSLCLSGLVAMHSAMGAPQGEGNLTSCSQDTSDRHVILHLIDL